MRDRECVHNAHGGRVRGRESLGTVPMSREPNMGLEPTVHEIMS